MRFSCLTQIYSSLDRVQKFTPFLLNCTASAVDALNGTLDFVSHLASSIQKPCTEEEEEELVRVLARLWALYVELDDGLKLQEVTTPAPHLLPKLKCRRSRDSTHVKSPLARVSLTRFQSYDSKDMSSD